MAVMNEFGRMAWEHWKKHRPLSLARIPEQEREEFFTALGQEVAEELEQRWTGLAGDDLLGETMEQKEGRLNMARLQAREAVLAEMVFLPEDPGLTTPQEPLSEATEEAELEDTMAE
ncbi:TnpV protein (plasmid) [Thermobifida halotolerans]|uniref:TnpV protein n=1 Tax=Thermobifida halotolerans TaxID=483545 RepID=A0AA97M665_9ACTN|nr:hypothetical protein [Thermobifida halotolerans]UOE22259.1 TnpV protein [Thermobifida halotolerans]